MEVKVLVVIVAALLTGVLFMCARVCDGFESKVTGEGDPVGHQRPKHPSLVFTVGR